MWEVLQRWVLALPVATPEQRARRLNLQKELEWVVGQLDDGVGIGEDGVRHLPSRRPNPGFLFPSRHTASLTFFFCLCSLSSLIVIFYAPM
jgi:membrane-associated phospholipid phosphatase